MANELSKSEMDRVRMVALYENLNKFYDEYLSYLDKVCASLIIAALTMRKSGNEAKYDEMRGVITDISTLMQDGEASKKIIEIEIEEMKDGKALKEFNYGDAEKASRDFKDSLEIVIGRAHKELADTYKERMASFARREKSTHNLTQKRK